MSVTDTIVLSSFSAGFLSIPFAFVTGVLGPPPTPPEAHAAVAAPDLTRSNF